MKKFWLSILILLVTFFLLAKDDEVKFPKDENGKIFYTEVVNIENTTKDVLYSRAIEWFAKEFKSAQNVLQMQDKESGKIVGKGNLEVIAGQSMGATNKGKVMFTISLYFKDGKYKYEITDLYHEGVSNPGYSSRTVSNGGALENEKPECGKPILGIGGMTMKVWGKIKTIANAQILLLIENLKKSMLTEASGDQW